MKQAKWPQGQLYQGTLLTSVKVAGKICLMISAKSGSEENGRQR